MSKDQKMTSLRTSFTKDEIIAKLLGWLRGPNYSKYVEMTDPDFNEKQLIQMATLEDSLEEHLSQLLNIAHKQYLACDENVSCNISIAKKEEIERVEKLTQKAFRFAADFEHELMKRERCMLEIDEEFSKKYDNIYYTIESAEKWSKDKFGISIINYVDPAEVIEEDNCIVPREDDSEGLSKTVTNNFYITFALLVDAFLEVDPDYETRIKKLLDRGLHWQTEDEEKASIKARLNVLKMSQYLSHRSRISGSLKIASGQSVEAIKTHIEIAMAYKDKVWAARKTPRVERK